MHVNCIYKYMGTLWQEQGSKTENKTKKKLHRVGGGQEVNEHEWNEEASSKCEVTKSVLNQYKSLKFESSVKSLAQ